MSCDKVFIKDMSYNYGTLYFNSSYLFPLQNKVFPVEMLVNHGK